MDVSRRDLGGRRAGNTRSMHDGIDSHAPEGKARGCGLRRFIRSDFIPCRAPRDTSRRPRRISDGMVAIGLTIPLSTAPRLCPAPGSTARMPPRRSRAAAAAQHAASAQWGGSQQAQHAFQTPQMGIPYQGITNAHRIPNETQITRPDLARWRFNADGIRPGGRRGCFGHRVVQQTAAHAMRHAHMAQATTCERPPKGGHLLLSTCTAAFQRIMKGVRAQRPAPHAYPALRHVEHPRGSQLGGSKGRSKINV
jgi:hypothetical protein